MIQIERRMVPIFFIHHSLKNTLIKFSSDQHFSYSTDCNTAFLYVELIFDFKVELAIIVLLKLTDPYIINTKIELL